MSEVINAAGIAKALRDAAGMAVAARRKGLAALASEIKKDTKRRIKTEKVSPDGVPWKPWSPAYAATRKKKHSLLIDSGSLRRRMKTARKSGYLHVGSPMPYAPAVQKARPFIGVAERQRAQLTKVLNQWAAEEIQRSVKS